MVIYDDFSGGDWGMVGAQHAARNQFGARNVMVYADGAVGPRPGMRPFAITGVPGNSTPLSMGRRPGTSQVWWTFNDGLDTRAFKFDTTTLTPAAVQVGANFASVKQVMGQSYDESNAAKSYAATDDGVMELNFGANTFTKLAGSPACVGLTIYGDRMVTAKSNIIRYSAPANFASWPASNTITVGFSKIAGLYSLRGELVIIKDDYSIWVLTGVPGVNEYLREVVPRNDGFSDTFQFMFADVERLSRLWTVSPSRESPRNVVPSVFSGSSIRDEATQELQAGTPALAIVQSLQTDGSVVMIGAVTAPSETPNVDAFEASNILIRYNGVWTRHQVDWTAGLTSPDLFRTPLNAIHVGEGRVIVFVKGATSAAGWVAYSFQASWDRPAVVLDDYFGIISVADPGLAVPLVGSMNLPEQWWPGGEDYAIHEVLVDASVYDWTGLFVAGTASLVISASYLGRRSSYETPGDGSGLDNAIQEGSLTVSASTYFVSSANIPGRATFRFAFEGQSSRGFQLGLDMSSMSIRRVTVIGHHHPRTSV